MPDKSIIKECVTNLTIKEYDISKMKVLNLRLKFLPKNNKKQPCMDVIQTAEICALDLEK